MPSWWPRARPASRCSRWRARTVPTGCSWRRCATGRPPCPRTGWSSTRTGACPICSRGRSRGIIGARLTSFVAESDHAALAAQDGRPEVRDLVEVELVDGEGRRVPVQVGASTLDVGAERCVCLTFADLTQLKRDQERAEPRPREGAGGVAAQVAVRGQHEPRDPHAAERRDRHGGAAARDRARRRTSASTPTPCATSGAALLAHGRRDPRLLEGRGRADWSSSEAPFDLPAVIEEVVHGAWPRRPRACELLRSIAGGLPRDRVRRRHPRVPGAHEPDVQRGEVHRRRARSGVQVAGERMAGDSAIRFEVSDTGIGIDADRGGAGSSSPSPRPTAPPRASTAGTGLGLAISKQLVELMGGEIGVRSSQGRGQHLLVHACRCRRADRAAAQPSPAARTAAADDARDGDRVLLAEDNEINQLVAVRMLEKQGFRVDVAVNGRVALEMCRRRTTTGRCSWTARCPSWTATRRRARSAAARARPAPADHRDDREHDGGRPARSASRPAWTTTWASPWTPRRSGPRSPGRWAAAVARADERAETTAAAAGVHPVAGPSVPRRGWVDERDEPGAGRPVRGQQSRAYLVDMGRAIEDGRRRGAPGPRPRAQGQLGGRGRAADGRALRRLCRTRARRRCWVTRRDRLRELELAAGMTQAAW